MLLKANKALANLNARSFFEKNTNLGSEKNDTSQFSQQRNSNTFNPQPLSGTLINSQPFPCKYPMAPSLNAIHPMHNSLHATNWKPPTTFGGFSSTFPMIPQRPGFSMDAMPLGDPNVQRVKNVPTIPNSLIRQASFPPELPFGVRNVSKKGQEGEMISTSTGIKSQQVIGNNEEKKGTVMNEVGTVLITNLDTLRNELKSELEKCSNAEDIQKIFTTKLNSFDATLKKIFASNKQLGDHLGKIGNVIEEQFGGILQQFEKNDKKIQETDEVLHTNMTANQFALYKKADAIGKAIDKMKKTIQKSSCKQGMQNKTPTVRNLKRKYDSIPQQANFVRGNSLIEMKRSSVVSRKAEPKKDASTKSTYEPQLKRVKLNRINKIDRSKEEKVDEKEVTKKGKEDEKLEKVDLKGENQENRKHVTFVFKRK